MMLAGAARTLFYLFALVLGLVFSLFIVFIYCLSQSRSIDKRHAVITYDHYDTRFKLKDLSSVNGVGKPN